MNRTINKRIRDCLRENGMYVWELGKVLNVSESSVTRIMRSELPEKRQNEIVVMIEEWSRVNG